MFSADSSDPHAPQADALSLDVTEADFRQTVLERSVDVPVLLDCWAPWCAPCRNLKPILEKLAVEYQGRFILAKLNTDEAPQISAALQIRSIPLVVLFVGGRPVDQFSGALPESQVRAFLDRHLGEQVSPVQALREQAAQSDAQTAEALLMQALDMEPDNLEVVWDLSERLLARGALDAAGGLLDSVPAQQRQDRHEALVKRLSLMRHRPAGDPQVWRQRIAQDPKDFESRLALATWLVHDAQFAEGFEQALEVVLRDKDQWRERARLQLVEWFAACPDAQAVSQGRRYLGMYLN